MVALNVAVETGHRWIVMTACEYAVFKDGEGSSTSRSKNPSNKDTSKLEAIVAANIFDFCGVVQLGTWRAVDPPVLIVDRLHSP